MNSADQLLWAHAGVVADQPVERVAQAVDQRRRQAQRRHEVALVMVLAHFGLAERGHRLKPGRRA
jgi:hypothetical protein